MVPLDYNLDSLRSLDFRSGTRFQVEAVSVIRLRRITLTALLTTFGPRAKPDLVEGVVEGVLILNLCIWLYTQPIVGGIMRWG